MGEWCDNCGLCCMSVGRPPYEEGEIALLPEELRAELEEFAMSPRFHLHSGDKNSPCFWLDVATGRCRHYQDRPRACREYQVGCRACQLLRLGAGLTIKGMPVVKD